MSNTSNADFSYWRLKLKEISTLYDDYDGQGTAAPNDIAIQNAMSVIDVLEEMNFVPDDLMPSVEEGVAFYLPGNGGYKFVECYNDGDILVVYSDRQGHDKIWQTGNTKEAIEDALKTLRDLSMTR
jgi:hypothetical protein